MPHEGDEPQRDKDANTPWEFPGEVRRAALPGDDTEPHNPSVLLCTVLASDALQVCARLEAEGIPCEARRQSDANPSDANPPAHEEKADIFVSETELSAAHEILNRGRGSADGNPWEPEKEDAPLYLANWICPGCRTRNLKLMPLSAPWRTVRSITIWLFAIPASLALIVWAAPAPELVKLCEQLPSWWLPVWITVVVILFFSVIFAQREKMCAKCGWRSESND